MVVLHLIEVELNESSAADLKSARKYSNSSEKV